MPKVPSTRRSRKQTSTEERRARAAQVKEKGLEMPFRCGRCEEKNLRCFVDTVSGRCAGCISVNAECSLFVSEEEWEKVQSEKRQKQLEVARAEERQALAAMETARLRRELLEVSEREHSLADRDLAILNLQDRAKEAEGNAAPGTGLAVEAPLPEPLADLGWPQADFLDPSFDPAFFLEDPFLAFPGAAGGTPVPVPCSS